MREYNRETGQPVAEDENVTEIKVLGPGCAQCHSLTEKIKKSLAEMNLAIGVEEVKDLKEISQHGVFGTPALIINGKLKITGRVPSDKQLKSWLEELRPSAQRKT
ncbi:MAG: hypothetical protein A2161_13230 [Candidatus Schekmanbacteria bacterium RBG_13_48_7]|uniref:Thioredoxin-like fold domain-containing protein n=1 Tax=Candidatus Schekmanbacteria bacterium RBG_13_48_7 TaxID=1817878 RepID=A0A1F7RPP8_9BACT|nr:MAG: hypothetical protein A2161_13230 [Candidatus Schekmanbacteria bacterium RBG_13_48_7]